MIVPKWLIVYETVSPLPVHSADVARDEFLAGRMVCRAYYIYGVLRYARVSDISEIVDEDAE